MKEYIIEKTRKIYKIKEDGKIYVKFNPKYKQGGRFKLCKYLNSNKYTQIKFNGILINKKTYLYEIFNDYKLKKDERVVFINEKNDYSKSNLMLKKIDLKKYPKYFRNINKKIYHRNHKNEIIATYESQNDCSEKTGIKQSVISGYLRSTKLKRFTSDGSYVTYDRHAVLNMYKGYRFRRKGILDSVEQYSKKGELINIFNSFTTAAEILDLPKNAASHINKCCQRKRKSSNGYIWKFGRDTAKKDDVFLMIYKEGKLIDLLKKRKEITIKHGYSRSTISSIISGRLTKSKIQIKKTNYETGVVLRKKVREGAIIYSSDNIFYAYYKNGTIEEVFDCKREMRNSLGILCYRVLRKEVENLEIKEIDYTSYLKLQQELRDNKDNLLRGLEGKSFLGYYRKGKLIGAGISLDHISLNTNVPLKALHNRYHIKRENTIFSFREISADTYVSFMKNEEVTEKVNVLDALVENKPKYKGLGTKYLMGAYKNYKLIDICWDIEDIETIQNRDADVLFSKVSYNKGIEFKKAQSLNI